MTARPLKNRFLFGFLAAVCLCAGVAQGSDSSRLRNVQGEVSLPIPLSRQLEERLYIVQLEEAPAMVYHQRREHKRVSEQRNAGSRRFNASDPDIQIYSERLFGRQTQLLQRLGINNKPVYRYSNTFNGFAVMMTEVQAEKLRGKRGVAGVWEDRLRYVSTIDSPDFLGLNDGESGLNQAQGLSGEDVIIAVIDSGIATDHPSLSDVSSGKPKGLCGTTWADENIIGQWLCARIKRKYEEPNYPAAPAKWQGICQTGDGFDSDQCNNKLIGARYYRAGFEADGRATDGNEFISPKDADGHGTHIASIAAGNQVTANIGGNSLGTIRGMAPRARIAVYKACWLQPGAVRASCSIADLQSAIDDAVGDGVDIINYSVGDAEPAINDPDDIALLTAADAGVFTAAAAGNEGPDNFGSINSPGTAPWVMTVGASSRAGREYDSAMSVNSPNSLADEYIALEASFTPTLSDNGPITADLILADDGVTTIEDPTPDEQFGTVYDACQPLINASDVKDNVVLISRGGCNFDLKIAYAGDAGAVGAIVFQTDSAPFVMDGNRNAAQIPAVMIGAADGMLFLEELDADGSIEVTLDSALFIAFDVDGNRMGSFSSTGPNPAIADILKPDITAPGVNILAGQSPDVANGLRGEEFQYLSGTSMSVPHVAGVAALIKQRYPDWTPAEIKSALMTTARQGVINADDDPATPFDMGAGHLEPNDSINPGVVYPANINDYDAFLCGLEGGNPRLTESECDAIDSDEYSRNAYDLNQPSVAISQLVSTTTVKRRVTNKGPAGTTYTASIDAPEGIDVTVDPAVFTLGDNETQKFEITFSNQSAAQSVWMFGAVTWEGDGTAARIPFAVKPVTFFATKEVDASGTTGSLNYEAQFGYSGDYYPAAFGPNLPCILPGDTPGIDPDLSQPCPNDDNNQELLQDDPYDFYELTETPDPWVARYFVEVPSAEELLLRVRLLNEYTSGNDDLDVYVYKCPTFDTNTGECGNALLGPVLVAQSTGGTSDEVIDIRLPTLSLEQPRTAVGGQGFWMIDVHAFNTETGSTDFNLFTWLVGKDDAQNMTVAPPNDTVTNGATRTPSVDWNGLDDELLLGIITHSDSDEDVETAKFGLTIIDIDARAP